MKHWIRKNQSQESILQQSETLYYENVSSRPTNVGLIVDSR